MTMTDTILFVKETQTCHYILHIATPRLCGVPGFKSPLDAREETYIRCREVLGSEDYQHADRSLPAADQPLKIPKRTKAVIAPPPVEEPAVEDKPAGKNTGNILRQALERLLSRHNLGDAAGSEIVVEQLDDGEGEVVIQFLDADVILDGDGDGAETITLAGDSLADVLRAAGYDIKGEKIKGKEEGQSKRKAGAKSQDGEAGEAKTQRRDEL